MNKINNNNTTYIHKKRVHTPTLEEPEMSTFGFPRKKFISEESFANDMAAMSLYPTINKANHFYQPHTNKNVVRIDDINEFLANEGGEDTAVYMETNGKSIINHDTNGLPLELRPGENKPRIPEFVLDSSNSIDPRDRIAFENMIKEQSRHNSIHIEILNDPTTHYTPTSMDID